MQNCDKSIWKDKIAAIINQKGLGGSAIVSNVYDLLKESGDYAPDLLQYFFVLAESLSLENKHSDSLYPPKKEAEYIKLFNDDGLFKATDKLLEQNYDQKTFYNRLWNLINKENKLRSEKQKKLLLFLIWQNPRIPYFHLTSGLKMSNADFSKTWDKIQEKITEARFVVFSKFEQRTEEASKILEILNSLKNDREKAVFMAVVVSLIEARTMKAMAEKLKADSTIQT